MKILVLGGTGFIGRNMLEHFAKLGHEIHAVHHLRAPYEMDGVEWHRADLRDDSYTLKKLIENTDIVIHAAATTSGSRDIVNNPAIHVTDNAVMGSVIFRAAHDAGVKHVIFFSCVTMFSGGEITEESPIDINPKYFGVAHTKMYLEKMCEFYAGLGRTKFTAIRHSNIYGQYDKFDLERSHVFGATMTKVMQAEDKIVVWGTGEESRDLLHVDDLCEFVELAIARQPEKFGLYNCGAGVAVKVKDFVQKIIDASGKKLTIEHDLTAPSIPTSLWLNCDKAQRELGWRALVKLEDGIIHTMDYWRKNVGVL